MIKVIPENSQTFDEPRCSLIKVASFGLSGADYSSLVKKAGYEFAQSVKQADLKDGDIPVRLIALGATEYYGPNRNGDGFASDVCKKYHHTFVKHAKFYRNHKNKDPNNSYGYVKQSHFNNDMQRIELLVVLNGNKKAAERNGGLVADEEMEKLAKGEDIAVSMACKVPFDICSICKNKAKSRAEYCTGEDEGGKCPGGGLKNKIASVLEDGRQLFAENTEPLFFDISRVAKPADRIAYTVGITKSAVFDDVKTKLKNGKVVSGSELAELYDVSCPNHVYRCSIDDLFVQKVANCIMDLAEMESYVESCPKSYMNFSLVPEVCWLEKWASFNKISTSLPRFTKFLIDNSLMLPFEAFVGLFISKDNMEKTASSIKRYLPSIYRKLVQDGEFSKYAYIIEQLEPAIVPCIINESDKSDLISSYSVDPKLIQNRARRGSLYRADVPMCKAANYNYFDPQEFEIAKLYALYKVACILKMDNIEDRKLLTEFAIRQNCM